MHIVIVDDDISSGILCKEAILEENKDCSITLLTNGIALKDHLKAHSNLLTQADLIFLDVNMQPVTGKEVLAEIKADPAYRRIPVIMLSSSKNNIDVIDCLNLHANCFITKDHDYHTFAQRISSLIHCWRNVATFPVKSGFTVAPPKNKENNALENENAD